MSYSKRFTFTNIAFALPLALLLSGCATDDLADLKEYAAKVHATKGGALPPLPEIKPYERYLYRSADANARDPFAPAFSNAKDIAKNAKTDDATKNKYLAEIQTHNPEELETFELDSLRMVGTLVNDAELWGIVLDHEGTVHRVKVGNYLGKNYGKIIQIAEERIELREIISDGQGSWDERQASMALNEQ
jgi:type IV pilus assembly protein PilP